MSSEPKLLTKPVRRETPNNTNGSRTPVKSARRPSGGTSQTPAAAKAPLVGHNDPNAANRNTNIDDAAEGTDAFRNRATEITQFKVFSRVRPFIQEELAEMHGQELRSIVEMTENKTVILDPKENWAPKAQFEFDGSLWSIPPSHKIVHTFQDTRRNTYDSQLDVYNIVAKDFVPHVFEGFNSCVLTYGQTGSGKTYTMMGMYDPHATCGGSGEEGIIPRVSNDLFSILAQREKDEQEKPADERMTLRVEVNFVEIYMERVRDLLDPALKNTKGNEKLQDARIRQDPYSGPFVEGVTKYQVENWSQCCTLLERGSMHRTTCATAVHNQSSRSHAIFQLTVIQEITIPAKDRYSRPTVRTQAGRINLVDLAGSERGGFQDYVKESAAINTSLLALRRVIDNLTERQNILMEQTRAAITGGYWNERPLPQVPFRDSILTWLLSDSIGGNARTTMVATLSPLAKNYGDTLATLQWSSKARNLVTLVKVNDAQTTITGGMTTKAGELSTAVRIQRQNIDTLQMTLDQKRAYAERLDRESRTMQASAKVNKAREDDIRREVAAIIVQRAFRRSRFNRKMKQLQLEHDKLRADVANREKQLRMSQLDKKAAGDADKKLLAKLQQLKDEGKQYQNEIQTAADNEAEFQRNYKSVESQYNMLKDEMGGDEAIIKREIESLQNKSNAVRVKTEKLRNDHTEMETQIKMMEEKVKESKTQKWRDQRAVDDREVEELRKKRDELLIKKEEAQRRLDVVKAKHDKVFAKKKKK